MISEKQFQNLIKSANGNGWVNDVLKNKTKEEIMQFVDEKKYFYEVNKKLAARIYLGNKELFSMHELLEKNEEELFEIINKYKF
jgi:hypothetical protein